MKKNGTLFLAFALISSGCVFHRHPDPNVQAPPLPAGMNQSEASQPKTTPSPVSPITATMQAAAQVVTQAGGADVVPTPTEVKEKEIRATFHFRNMRLDDILKLFSKESGANFITDDKIKALTFTAYFQDVTIREALDALLSSRGLSYEQYVKSNIYVVRQRTENKPRTVTRLFKLSNILLGDSSSGGGESTGASKSGFSFVDSSPKSSGGGDSKGSSSASSSIVSVLQGLLSENGKIQTEPYTNSLIITDLPERFPPIENLIEQLDIRPPQVNIEVQMVEVNSSKLRRVGLQYGLTDGTLAKLYGPAQPIQFPAMKGNWIAPATSSATGSSGSGSYTGLLSLQELGVVLRALETSGAGDYLARPNVMTLNNKTAVLSVTSNTAVGIQSASMISQSGLLATTAERYRTGITLRVTPQVSADDWILLQISPTISRPNNSEFFPGQFVDPTDVSLNTSVRVKSGETVMLGGLYINQKSKSAQRVPILGSIPLLNQLFKTSENSSSKDELMIFITPRIVGR
jgi:type IV pilus assembly protein PilQ